MMTPILVAILFFAMLSAVYAVSTRHTERRLAKDCAPMSKQVAHIRRG